ncbi:hypothetical protein KPATCC21470_2009 [Kitasatospora purpeofusca]
MPVMVNARSPQAQRSLDTGLDLVAKNIRGLQLTYHLTCARTGRALSLGQQGAV